MAKSDGFRLRDNVRGEMRIGARGFVAPASSPLTLAYQSWTLDSAALPDCTGDATCVALCYSTEAPGPASTTPGRRSTLSRKAPAPPMPRCRSSTLSTMTNVTAASAPTIAAVPLNAVYNSAHTVVLVGTGRPQRRRHSRHQLEQFDVSNNIFIPSAVGRPQLLLGGRQLHQFGTATASAAARRTSRATVGSRAHVDAAEPLIPRACNRRTALQSPSTSPTAAPRPRPATSAVAQPVAFPLQGPLAFVAWFSRSEDHIAARHH